MSVESAARQRENIWIVSAELAELIRFDRIVRVLLGNPEDSDQGAYYVESLEENDLVALCVETEGGELTELLHCASTDGLRAVTSLAEAMAKAVDSTRAPFVPVYVVPRHDSLLSWDVVESLKSWPRRPGD